MYMVFRNPFPHLYQTIISVISLSDTMYQDFVEHPKMIGIRDRTVWVHVDVPGQGQDMEDLRSE